MPYHKDYYGQHLLCYIYLRLTMLLSLNAYVCRADKCILAYAYPIFFLVDVKQFYDIWSSTDVSVEGILCVL